MPKRRKSGTTQPPTKRRSPRASNSNTEQASPEQIASGRSSPETQSQALGATQQQTGEQASGITQQQTEEQAANGRWSQCQQTDEEATTITGTPQQAPLTQIASKLDDMIKLLTTSLNSHQASNPPTNVSTTAPTPIDTTQLQGTSSSDESGEALSVVSEHPPVHSPPAARIMATGNSHRSTFDTSLTRTQTPAMSLPPVTAKLREKIISGEFVDFNLLLPKAMFSGSQPPEPQKSFTVQLTSGNDDFVVRPTQTSKKISSFQSWMEAWNIYLAIIVDHAPSRAPSLIAYQHIITSVSNHHPPLAWLNYDVRSAP